MCSFKDVGSIGVRVVLMVGWSVDDELERTWKEAVVA
jgi:hypothetical protein